MSKIERRRFVVSLLQGNYEQDLADLAEQAIAAAESEQQQGPMRTGQRSKAIDLAKKHEALKAEAQETAVKVTVWALGYSELPALQEQHPPRDDVNDEGKPLHPTDHARGVNMATFPKALLCASLVEPGKYETVDEMVAAGAEILDGELQPSTLHYRKLETAAWNVNMGAENLGKGSLLSLLMSARESSSKEPSEQE